MNTRLVTIRLSSLKECKTFECIEDLAKMISDLSDKEHTGSLMIKGSPGDYVFSKMDTETLLDYIKHIDLWKLDGNDPKD